VASEPSNISDPAPRAKPVRFAAGREATINRCYGVIIACGYGLPVSSLWSLGSIPRYSHMCCS
jgi:hypothetical protein